MDFSSQAELEAAGFVGFVPIRELMDDDSPVPAAPGVYLVVRKGREPPSFVTRGIGGFFKGKDPNVDCAELAENWVDDVGVLYIGKAGGAGSSATLKKRLRQ
jgi:hypothetical protein